METIMKRAKLPLAISMVLGMVLAPASTLHAAGGPPDGKGGKPSVEYSNNLSYPAIFTGTGVTLNGVTEEWALDGVFPTSKSFGCAKPETIGTTTYVNTSCVSSTGTPLTYDACVAGPCAGYAVDAIYWQKTTDNVWQAETLGPNKRPQYVDYVDWGDNLETVSWKTSSVIRVETTPFTTLAGEETLMGFQTWHVSGQGPDEMWGVRGNGPDLTDPYVYDSPFAIIHSPAARLNISKLVNGSGVCPTTGNMPPPSVSTTWKKGVLAGSWSGLHLLRDTPFTAELNIGGKFVYGYNWQLQRDTVPTEVSKAGWWRLTFYTENNGNSLDSIVFDDANIPTAPPTLPDAYTPLTVQQVTRTRGISILADTGPLYKPTVDAANNLTYIDICIVEGKSGGKKGGR
jgi:hypothetical protein